MRIHEKPLQTETPIDSVGDAIVAAMRSGGVDHLFFTSGSEIGSVAGRQRPPPMSIAARCIMVARSILHGVRACR
jgi:hypothetical protein